MDDFPIVDPHHHLYDFDSGNYPWLTADPMLPRVFGDYTAIKTNYLIKDFLADTRRQNVTKSVHVQMEYDHSRPVEETRWL
jgi:predicted TIM-barrel fold metal-dependent hydrolase